MGLMWMPYRSKYRRGYDWCKVADDYCYSPYVKFDAESKRCQKCRYYQRSQRKKRR